jgi:amino acid transporter
MALARHDKHELMEAGPSAERGEIEHGGSSPAARGDVDSEDDARALGRLGYAQELLRRMGGFSSFAVSFSIISVLTGCITAYSDAIGPGGPAALGMGWPLVSVGTMLVALAMAELASAFPTAGALYHWSALLGGPAAGWLTAAVNITGQLAIVAAIDFGCAKELAPTLGLEGLRPQLVLLGVILASHALVNAFSVRLVAMLNDFSATVHIIGVAVIVIALFAFGRAQPVSFLAYTGFTTRPDGSHFFGFLGGLVLSMFTFTGYDASAHLAEETHDPARRTAWGIVSSVAVSAVAGYLLLTAVTLGIKHLPTVAADAHAPLLVMRGAFGDTAGRAAMGLALVAMWFCGLSSVTSASRTLFAFARDGGLPASRRIGRVHARTRTPVVAIAIVTIGPFLLVIGTAPFAQALFDAMAKMATMALYVSYAVPIGLGVVARRRGTWKTLGPFSLGGLGVPFACAALLWSFFVLIVCSLPPNQLPAGMLGVLVVMLLLVYAFLFRGRFTGPKVSLASLEGRTGRGDFEGEAPRT